MGKSVKIDRGTFISGMWINRYMGKWVFQYVRRTDGQSPQRPRRQEQ